MEKTLEYSKFVSLFTFVSLALPSSGRAQEENVKISQTLPTQNSSLVSSNGLKTEAVVSRDQTKSSAPLNQQPPIRRRAPTGEVEEEVEGRREGRKERRVVQQHPGTGGRDHGKKPPKC